MSKKNEKHTRTPFFWSGDSLMGDGNPGTFSSHHVLTLGDIKPSEADKEFIIKCVNEYKKTPSLKYLQKCVNSAHSADPYHYDVAINDLRLMVNRLSKALAGSNALNIPKAKKP